METMTSADYIARYGSIKPRLKSDKKAQQNKVQPENNGSNTIIRATFDLPPLGNHAWRIGKGGKPHLTEETREFRTSVSETADKRGIVPMVGPVSVTVDVYRKAKRGDLDGYSKQLLDAMQGHLYFDDKQIIELHMRRFDDRQHPRVEVRVESVKSR